MKRVAFFWDHFAEYHVDRCAAAAALLSARGVVVEGVQIAPQSDTYAWRTDVPEKLVDTLFPGGNADQLPLGRLVRAIVARARSCDAVFLCNYNRLDTLLSAIVLRALGRRVFLMFDSKFDDKPRRVLTEFLKRSYLAPFQGALVAGARSRDYLKFLGFRGPIELGYDTVSIDRIRAYASGYSRTGAAITFIGRFVEKKDLQTLLRAYAIYVAKTPAPLPLRLVGTGPLEHELRLLAAGISGGQIEFLPFADQAGVARILSAAATLVLPSVEEQWGLVVNEAVAVGIPVITSFNVGANDHLLSVGRNGFAFAPGDAPALASLLAIVCHSGWQPDEDWQREAARLADASQFAASVERMLRS